MKYAHLTIEVRLLSYGVQVDMYDRTIATPEGLGIIHTTERWDFLDNKPICDRAKMFAAVAKTAFQQASKTM